MQAGDRYADWVVVWDPGGEWGDGSVVRGQTARVLYSRGVVLLPVETGLLRVSGVGGYAKRSWGSGVPLDFGTPRLTCPVAAFATPLQRRLRWAARLVAGEDVLARLREGMPFEGTVQVTSDAGQRGAMHAGVRQEEGATTSRELGAPDARGGWTAEGSAQVALADAGVHGFALYGCMPGVRVAWLAVSLVDEA